MLLPTHVPFDYEQTFPLLLWSTNIFLSALLGLARLVARPFERLDYISKRDFIVF